VISVDEANVRLAEEGYCVLEGLLDPAEADRLGELSRPRMKAPEPNFFHLGGALNDVPQLASLCLHPTILEIAEHELGEGFILANNVDVTLTEPGAPSQPLHADVPLSWMPQPWPAFPTALQVFWMLTDYTPDNGATVVVPFSHHARRPPTRAHYPQELPVLGSKGSAFLMRPGVWHRRGENTSQDRHRGTVNIFYLPRYIHRPKDTWPLVKQSVYERLPARLQEMTSSV
jgi:ectoine hydroxylase-related dioxygenase (phytanoyl-CoA dioxygenase family)